jgi:hypothetical protein
VGRKKRPPVSEQWLAKRTERETKKLAYGGGLRGLGHQQLARPEGLKGSTFGPAGEGRRLTGAKREAAEKELKEKGQIGMPKRKKR